MSDYFDDPYARKKSIHPGFQYGFIGALISISVNLILLLINSGDQRGDSLAWFIQLIVYVFVSRSAAEAQYQSNQRRGDFEHLRGVKAAGLGAGLTTSILTWIYIIIRGIVRDSMGIFVLMEPFSFACLIVVDVILAMALGAWGGSAVAKKYDVDSSY
ncbi:MAG: hypothetical protein Fur002_04960 [Anaerolineales bacterium]